MTRDEAIREVVSDYLCAYNLGYHPNVSSIRPVMDALGIKREEYKLYLPREPT